MNKKEFIAAYSAAHNKRRALVSLILESEISLIDAVILLAEEGADVFSIRLTEGELQKLANRLVHDIELLENQMKKARGDISNMERRYMNLALTMMRMGDMK